MPCQSKLYHRDKCREAAQVVWHKVMNEISIKIVGKSAQCAVDLQWILFSLSVQKSRLPVQSIEPHRMNEKWRKQFWLLKKKKSFIEKLQPKPNPGKCGGLWKRNLFEVCSKNSIHSIQGIIIMKINCMFLKTDSNFITVCLFTLYTPQRCWVWIKSVLRCWRIWTLLGCLGWHGSLGLFSVVWTLVTVHVEWHIGGACPLGNPVGGTGSMGYQGHCSIFTLGTHSNMFSVGVGLHGCPLSL